MDAIRWFRTGTGLIVLALALALGLAASQGGVGAATSEDVAVSGVLDVIWGDPPPDSTAEPSEKYLLSDAQGNDWWLEVGPEVAEAAGGLLALNRKQVQVIGEPISSGDVNTIRVQSIGLSSGPSGPAGAAASPAMPVTGSVAWVTLPCRFNADADEQRDLGYFEGLMGSVKPGLDHFWRELSYNTVNLTGSEEYDWEEMAYDRAYYHYWDAEGEHANLDLLAQECVDAHDADVDFSLYQGINFMFNDVLDCCAWGGSVPVDTDEGTIDFRATWMPPWAFTHQGVLGHETGHGFGLPHSSGPYAATYDSKWDVMSAAKAECRNPDATYGCVGAHTISYHKDMLGAIPGARKYVADSSANQVITLEHLALPGPTGYLMAQIPVGIAGLDFYTVEAREFEGYDVEIPGEAVIIHTVDTSRDRQANVVDADGDGDPNDDGAMWLPGEMFVDAANGISIGVLSKTSSSFVIAINPTTDLAIQKTDSPDPVIAGQQLLYTISVVNNGPGPAIGVTVTDTLPLEVTYVSDTDNCTFSAGTGPGGKDQLTCDLGGMASGEERSFVVKVAVDPDAVAAGGIGMITNTATVASESPDSNLSNNTATEVTTVLDSADLRVTKLCKPDRPLRAGETATCTIYVDNFGPSTARDVTLTDANVSNGSFTVTSVTPSQGTCDPPPPPLPWTVPAPGTATIVCDLGDLDPASSSTTGRATVTVQVKANEAQDINNIADAISDTPDPDISNNQAQDSISVTAVADLQICKFDTPGQTGCTGTATALAGPDPVIAGNTVQYEILVTNVGPSTAANVVMQDMLPAGVSLVSASPSSGACDGGAEVFGQILVTCDLGNFASGETKTIYIVARVGPGVPAGTIINSATVSSDTFDPDNSDNLASAATTVEAEADLALAKAAFGEPIAGQDIHYEYEVSNMGPSVSRDVTLRDSLPAKMEFLSAFVDVEGGTGGVPLPCTIAVGTNKLSCPLGDIAPTNGVPIIVTVDVHIRADVPEGTLLTNSADLLLTDTPDPDLANNRASATVTVHTKADLSITKETDRNLFKPSTTVKYTIRVTNNGPSDAQNVVVVDMLPPAKTGYRVFDTGYLYDPYGCLLGGTALAPTLRCDFGTLAAGASIQFDLYFRVVGNKGEVTNTVTVRSTTVDPNLANNTAERKNLIQGKDTGKR